MEQIQKKTGKITKSRTIRMPIELDEKILKEAEEQNRDYTKQVIHILTKYYKLLEQWHHNISFAKRLFCGNNADSEKDRMIYNFHCIIRSFSRWRSCCRSGKKRGSVHCVRPMPLSFPLLYSLVSQNLYFLRRNIAID